MLIYQQLWWMHYSAVLILNGKSFATLAIDRFTQCSLSALSVLSAQCSLPRDKPFILAFFFFSLALIYLFIFFTFCSMSHYKRYNKLSFLANLLSLPTNSRSATQKLNLPDAARVLTIPVVHGMLLFSALIWLV